MTDATACGSLIQSLWLSTLARSSNLSNMVPVIWEMQNVYYLKLMDKSGK